MISEPCDNEDLSHDAENSALPSQEEIAPNFWTVV